VKAEIDRETQARMDLDRLMFRLRELKLGWLDEDLERTVNYLKHANSITARQSLELLLNMSQQDLKATFKRVIAGDSEGQKARRSEYLIDGREMAAEFKLKEMECIMSNELPAIGVELKNIFESLQRILSILQEKETKIEPRGELILPVKPVGSGTHPSDVFAEKVKGAVPAPAKAEAPLKKSLIDDLLGDIK
jgi:hypothetical protein